jgi:hypothetical protein
VSGRPIASEQLPLIYTIVPEGLVALRNRFGNVKPSSAGVTWNLEEMYDLKADARYAVTRVCRFLSTRCFVLFSSACSSVIPLVIGITLVSFFVMQLAPGDYLDALRGQPQIRPKPIERLRSEFGLVENPTLWDQVKQYGRWLGNAVRGNFGFSFTYKIETFELIKQRLYTPLFCRSGPRFSPGLSAFRWAFM